MKINPDDLIRQKTAAKMRGVSPQAINLLIQRGKLTKFVIDGFTFVSKEEVENYEPSIGGRPKKAETETRRKRFARPSKSK